MVNIETGIVIREMIGSRNIVIEVDGGVDPHTGRLCVEAGADVLVAGNSLFRHQTLDLEKAIVELRTNCGGAR